MEFETENKGQQPGNVTDEIRLAASTKRVTLTPLHTEITLDTPADELVASHHVLEPPIGNIPSDQENTSANLARENVATDATPTPAAIVQQATAQKSRSTALKIVIPVVGVLLIVGVLVTVFIFR